MTDLILLIAFAGIVAAVLLLAVRHEDIFD